MVTKRALKPRTNQERTRTGASRGTEGLREVGAGCGSGLACSVAVRNKKVRLLYRYFGKQKYQQSTH